MKRLLKCIYTYVALGLLIIAFVLACFCYHTVNSDSYQFFWEEYSDAATSRWEYQQAARAATNATEKSYYEDWADFYDNLEDSWWRRIQETKTKAKIYGLFAGTCGLLGFAFMIPAYLEIRKSNTPVKQAIPHGFCRACGTPLNPGSRFCAAYAGQKSGSNDTSVPQWSDIHSTVMLFLFGAVHPKVFSVPLQSIYKLPCRYLSGKEIGIACFTFLLCRNILKYRTREGGCKKDYDILHCGYPFWTRQHPETLQPPLWNNRRNERSSD